MTFQEQYRDEELGGGNSKRPDFFQHILIIHSLLRMPVTQDVDALLATCAGALARIAGLDFANTLSSSCADVQRQMPRQVADTAAAAMPKPAV